MPRKSKAPANTIIAEGVDAFPENGQLIRAAKAAPPLTVSQLLEYHNPKYQGYKRPGCILVRKRAEITYQEHYLDIYACLTGGLDHECLRSGWEVGFWNGTESKKLK